MSHSNSDNKIQDSPNAPKIICGHPPTALMSFTELTKLTGYTTRGRMEKWLQKNKIAYYLGKDNFPCTTLTALNSALGVAENISTLDSSESIEFD